MDATTSQCAVRPPEATRVGGRYVPRPLRDTTSRNLSIYIAERAVEDFGLGNDNPIGQ